jgi:hypothetical protein
LNTEIINTFAKNEPVKNEKLEILVENCKIIKEQQELLIRAHEKFLSKKKS